ncbi:unnamed protein product [Arabidopsis lyrata]|uniref:Predicted protein n=1 Tax=Arabidopsis lyrata subsp. lyrata TaxID=81972 RepID=D7KT11_ARALL|nr:predicted protein [Arabidopsis lyrata subsp. lyrata]CAH8257082.1 unnamed protein product [Arabidopsis lyrata]
MTEKKTQTSLPLSFLFMLLCLSFHVRVTDARLRLRHVVHIPTPSSGYTPPSKPCGSGIHHVARESEKPCRLPRRPSGADP